MLSLSRFNKKQLIILFAIVSILAFGRSSIQMYVIVAFTYLSLLFLYVYNQNFPKVRRLNLMLFDYIPLLIFGVWLYGIFLGLFLGNNKQFVFMNFAGMTAYLIYYCLLITNFSKEFIYKLVIYIGLFILIQNIIISILLFVFNVNVYYGDNKIIGVLFGYFLGGSSTGQIRVLSPSQLIVFPIFTITLAYFFNKHLKRYENIKFLKNFTTVYLFLSIFTVIFLPASKGYVLAGVAIFLFVILFSETAKGKINLKRSAFIFILFISLLVILNFSGYINIITSMFDEDDVSNIARYSQLTFLIEDMKLFGNGLGSLVEGSSRNADKPYGFELTYINIIHKFGIISLILFLIYLYTIIKIYVEYKKNLICKRYIYASMGLMAYLFPSIGNPILFGPQAVVMHVLALYLLRKDFNGR